MGPVDEPGTYRPDNTRAVVALVGALALIDVALFAIAIGMIL